MGCVFREKLSDPLEPLTSDVQVERQNHFDLDVVDKLISFAFIPRFIVKGIPGIPRHAPIVALKRLKHILVRLVVSQEYFWLDVKDSVAFKFFNLDYFK